MCCLKLFKDRLIKEISALLKEIEKENAEETSRDVTHIL